MMEAGALISGLPHAHAEKTSIGGSVHVAPRPDKAGDVDRPATELKRQQPAEITAGRHLIGR